MEWTQEKVLLLIDVYRKHPVLWDNRNKYYRDKNKRNDALSEISSAIDEPKDEIIRKIKNLQSHFSRELRKETNATYKSNWFAYESMLFVRDKNKSNTTKCTEDVLLDDYEDEQNQMQDSPHEQNTQTNAHVCEQPKEKPASLQKNIPVKKRKADTLVSEAYSIMKEIYAGKRERDVFTVFGEHVAMRVRNLPTEHAQVVVQQLINTIIFEAELGKYNNPDVNQTYVSTMQPSFSPEHKFSPVSQCYTQPDSAQLSELVYTSIDPTSSGSNSVSQLLTPVKVESLGSPSSMVSMDSDNKIDIETCPMLI